MARMSVDDMLSRDPRITVLASLLGWSRRETAGCLILEVWPICYDQRTHLISERIIDAAAGTVGFAKAMVESELATVDRSGKIAIKGAKERIEYLDHKKRAGRQGGLKSGETRAGNSKQTPSNGGTTPQAAGNPSASASVPPSASASPPVPASDHDHNVAPTDAAQPSDRSRTDKKAAKVPDRAWKAADYLRSLVLEDDPAALVSKQDWGADVKSGWRLSWADEIRLMVERDRRTYEQIADVMHYVFREQPPGARFVVQSAEALREKWDRIQAVRRNNAQRADTRAQGRVEPKKPDEYPEGDVPI